MGDIAPINRSQGSFSLTPQSLDEAMKYADLISKSEIVPKDYQNKPSNVLVAVQMGAELGLPPLQALQNIAVVNGRPAVWGDSLMAIARAHPSCEYITESFDESNMTATCKVKRRGNPEEIRTYSQRDAELAGLWGRNTWKAHPKRMLQMRARGFAIRDVFADALRGIALAEEVQDLPPRDMGDADVVDRKPAEPELLPNYPEESFKTNLPKWLNAIEAGKKTADQVIATVESKYTLSEEQKAKIKQGEDPAPSNEKDDWVAEYETTEEGAQ